MRRVRFHRCTVKQQGNTEQPLCKMASLTAFRGPSLCSRSNRSATAAPSAAACRRALVSRSVSIRDASAEQAQQLREPQQQRQLVADQSSNSSNAMLHQSTQSGAETADQPSPLPFFSCLSGHAGAQVTLGLAVALLALTWASEPAAAADGMQQHSIQPIMDIAEGEEFWGNVAKYGRYFVTVMLGTGYVMVQPIIAAFKKPVTAILAVVGLGGGFLVLKFVLNAMLGIEDAFDYQPGSIVPYENM